MMMAVSECVMPLVRHVGHRPGAPMLPLRNRTCPLRVVRLARLLRQVQPAMGCLLAVSVAPWEAFSMDHPDFDRLARTMSTGASRRSLLRRMAASAIASP